MRRIWILILLTPLPVCGQEYKKTVKLTVSPAAAPSPALRYVLLPPLGDLRPGNAAYWYERAAAPESVSHILRHPDYFKLGDWLALPLDRFPRQKAEQFRMQSWTGEIDFAARHQQCDWHLIERIKKDGIALLLPDVQFFRQYARFLAVRARLEILDGDYEKAIRTMQTAFALARHVTEGPTLIHGFVGAAISHITFERVDDLIQQPGAPNLYWALTHLPRPFINFRKGFEAERLMADSLLRGIRATLEDPDQPPFSNRRIQKMIDELTHAINASGFSRGGNSTLNRLFVAVAAAKMYPNARKLLQSRGFTKEQIDRLPVVQVAFMQTLVEYDRMFDESLKWTNLPFHVARHGMRKADDDMRKRVANFRSKALIPFGELILPAFYRVIVARVNVDRKIAVLRHVEALRMYAHHQGRFPTTLAKMQEQTPLPVDPATGKPFEYRLVKPNQAILFMPAPPGETPLEVNALRWELTLRARKNGK